MSETSTFDPDTFLSTSIEGALSTRIDPLPSDDYTATIDSIGQPRQVGESVVVDVVYIVHDEELASNMGLERLIVRQGLFLDVDASGGIAQGPNKNVQLGRLRAAVGQNGPEAWNFSMLQGAGPLRITVGQNPDKHDPSIIYNRVNKTMPMG